MRSHTHWPWSSWIFHDRISRVRKRWNLSIRWRTAPSSGSQSCVHTHRLKWWIFLDLHCWSMHNCFNLTQQWIYSRLPLLSPDLHPLSTNHHLRHILSQPVLPAHKPVCQPVLPPSSPALPCMTQHIQTCMYCCANRFSMHPLACWLSEIINFYWQSIQSSILSITLLQAGKVGVTSPGKLEVMSAAGGLKVWGNHQDMLMLSAYVWTCRCSCSLFRLKNCWNWLSSICSPSVPCLFPVPQWWVQSLQDFLLQSCLYSSASSQLGSARLGSDSLDISLLPLFKVLQSRTESRPDPDLLSDSSFTSTVSEGLVQTLFHYSRSNMVSFSSNDSLTPDSP